MIDYKTYLEDILEILNENYVKIEIPDENSAIIRLMDLIEDNIGEDFDYCKVCGKLKLISNPCCKSGGVTYCNACGTRLHEEDYVVETVSEEFWGDPTSVSRQIGAICPECDNKLEM